MGRDAAAVASLMGVLLTIAVTGFCCLVPAAIIRYAIVRRPLGTWPAALIAIAIYCIITLTIFGLNPHNAPPKISPFWMLMSFLAARLMTRGRQNETLINPFANPKEGTTRLSRAQMMARLTEMIADPDTPEDRRVWANDRLNQFEAQTAAVKIK